MKQTTGAWFGGLRLPVSVAAVCCIGSVALGQEPVADSAQDGEKLEEIVVTGSLIRGAAPTGTELISVMPQDIQATGATSSNDLLASVPQISNFFNNPPQIGGAGNNGAFQTIRPEIRPVAQNIQSTSGALALVLVDGHRIVGSGVTDLAPDPDVVPASAIERVEILPDGGSSIYGADAVGGVINFITKRHFSGAEVAARYGHASNYNTADGHLTLGTDWGSGSAYVSYNFSYHDPLWGSDRRFVKDLNWATGLPAGMQCNSPNVAIGATNYAWPGLVPGTANTCDPSRLQTVYDREERTGVFGNVSQDFGDSFHFDVQAFFTHRLETANAGPAPSASSSVNITPANPYYDNFTGTGATQTVTFSYGPALGYRTQRQDTDLSEWEITPTLAIDLGGKWQLRTLLNYGRSVTSYFQGGINPALQAQYAAGTTTATAIDPYNIAASNPQLLANLANWESFGVGISELENARMIADGSLFTLPGGDVGLAVGGEYSNTSFKSQNSGLAGNLLGAAAESQVPFLSYGQKVTAAFGELQIPIVGQDNRVPLVSGLRFSVSGRFDKYSDFGHTFNPKFAVNYQPVDWIDVRGNYSHSFNAPTPVDELGSQTSKLAALSPYLFPPIGVIPPAGSYGLLLYLGAANHLQPQTAHTYSFGLDVHPPVVPGLTLSATYWHIDFDGILSLPPFYNPVQFYPYYGKLYTLNPTQAQIAAFASQVPGGLAEVAQFLQPGGPLVTELVNAAKTNLGNSHVAGIDFSPRYTRTTGFGSIDASITGTYQLKNETNAVAGTPFVSNIENGTTRLTMASILGANWDHPFGADSGNLRSQVTWNHSAGYSVTESPINPQTHVGSFEVINLFFNYNFNGTALTKDLALSLNVGNVLDRDPPVCKALSVGGTVSPNCSGNGYGNGFTLGRLIQVGIDKKF